ncbi:MAG: hypothetical protein H7Y59_18285 [Anaerolineales bacterium]|nr:hypothetical protein [Anaerolineales bacterium]
MKITTRERRDWTLLIFIIPIGIIFMLIAGQIAIRIVPEWSINAGMQSNLDPATAPKQQAGLVPVLPEILTPLGWFDTFLTPNSGSGDDIVFPPFIVFEPTATPSPTSSPTASPTITETATTPVTPSPTVVTTVPSATPTKKPPDEDDTPTPTIIVTATGTATPLPPIESTIDPSLTIAPPPAEIEIGTPDGDVGSIAPGTYIILNISGRPIVVTGSSETNYDFVYYESDTGGGNVLMDSVVLGISQLADGSIFYEVFNWGDNNRDTNTNVDTNDLPADLACTSSPPECDNRVIPATDLHPDSTGGTGILIDVDNAPSAPPAGSYDYIVVISPLSGAPDGSQIDSVEVTEVAPTP